MAVSTQYRTRRYTTYGNVAYQPEPEPIRCGAQRPGQEAERVRRPRVQPRPRTISRPRVQVRPGENVVSVVPLVTPFSTAQFTAPA